MPNPKAAKPATFVSPRTVTSGNKLSSCSASTSSGGIPPSETKTESMLFIVCKHFIEVNRYKQRSTVVPDKVCNACKQRGGKLNAFWNRGRWQVVRERPVGVYGQYQLCKRYETRVPCRKIPCTFAHGEMERIAWTKERQEGVFLFPLLDSDIVASVIVNTTFATFVVIVLFVVIVAVVSIDLRVTSPVVYW